MMNMVVLESSTSSKSSPHPSPLLHATRGPGFSCLTRVSRTNRAAPINALDFSPDNSMIAFAAGKEVMAVSKSASGEWFTEKHNINLMSGKKYTGHKDTVMSVAFSPDGTRLLTSK
jgi:WD40 repeat protein